MTDIVNDEQLTYAEKIAKLLRKAETTEHQEEADALFAKAQQLMVKYAISEQLVAVAKGQNLVEQDHVVEENITYTGIYHRFLFEIGRSIAQANDCRTLILKGSNYTTLYVVGMSKDVDRVKLLDASIQLQASVAMRAWWRGVSARYDWMTAMQKAKERRAFLHGYAQGVGTKLLQAKRAGVNDAVKDEAARANVAEDVARKSTELVLVSNKERVQSWYDERYGHAKSTRTAQSYGGYGSTSAGREAGLRANVGTTGIGGSRKGITGR